MIRQEKFDRCLSAIDSDSNHLHISKDVVVQDFVSNLRNQLERESKILVINVIISKTGRAHILKKIHFEAKSEYSTLGKVKKSILNIRSFTSLIKHFPGLEKPGVIAESVAKHSDSEAEPYYKKVEEDLKTLSNNTDIVVFIDNKSEGMIESFGWISELEVPINTTIITHDYPTVSGEVESQKQVNVGRLNEEQTSNLISNEIGQEDDDFIKKIHETHHGNPFAIRRALEYESPDELIQVEKVWEEVYESKITPKEQQLLYDSAHLVDLLPREISLISSELAQDTNDKNVISKTEARRLLSSLNKKGVVGKSESNTFIAGEYLRKFFLNQIDSDDLEKRHKEAFKYYLKKWSELHKTEIRENSEKEFQNYEGSDDLKQYLYLSLDHFYKVDPEMSESKFIDIINSVSKEGEWDKSENVELGDLFIFSIFAQRLVYTNNKKAIRDITTALFGTSMEDGGRSIMEGLWSAMLGDSIKDILNELSKGWNSEDLRFGDIGTKTGKDRKKIVATLNETIDSDLLDDMPSDLKNCLYLLLSLLSLDNSEAKEAYSYFGKKAENNGLEEGPFCDFLENLIDLVDLISGESDDKNDRNIVEEFETVDKSIRSRTDIIDVFNDTRTDSQEEFDNKLLNVKDSRSKVNNLLLKAGDSMSDVTNPIFPFTWYLIADQISSSLYDAKSQEIYRKRVEYYKDREYWEKNNEFNVDVDYVRKMVENADASIEPSVPDSSD